MRHSNRSSSVDVVTGRVAATGLAAVLLLLTSFSVWTGIRATRASASVDRWSKLDAAYTKARFSIAEQEALVLRYQSSPQPQTRKGVETAATNTRNALEYITAHGSPQDRALAQRLLRGISVYMSSADLMFRAIQAHQPVRARAIESEFDAVYPWVEAAASNAAARNRAHTTKALGSLRSAERIVLFSAPLVFVVGVGLVVLFGSLLVRARRRYADAQARELDRLARAAFVDSLTGVANHRALIEHLEAPGAVERTAIVVCDMDSLKPTNDIYGHHAGDEQLRTLADALKANARKTDEIYRAGGDEFVAILGDSDEFVTIAYLDRVRRAVAEAALPSPISFTAGIAAGEPGHTREEILRRADRALIEAKRRRVPFLLHTAELEHLAGATQGSDERHVRVLATALARAVDAKDSYTRSHCETVANLCARIGLELGLGPERLRRLRLAGLLHDVGKIGIADAILQKPGPLTAGEYEVMKTHSILGHSIVHAAELDEEAHWILHHHERVDGGGYPDGLTGDAIPLESRIILVADAFEAITADRPYRPRRSVPEAVDELAANSGTQFDPSCVEALRTALRDSQDVIAEPSPARPQLETPAAPA